MFFKHNVFVLVIAVLAVITSNHVLQESFAFTPTPPSSSKTTFPSTTTDLKADAEPSSDSSSTTTTDECPSKVFKSMLGGEMSMQTFLNTIWQTKPMVFTRGMDYDDDMSTARTSTADINKSLFDLEKMNDFPLEETIEQGWNVLTELMNRAPLLGRNNQNLELPVIMMNGNAQPLEEVMRRYGKRQTLFSAYLDGCSVVQNHADLLSPWIASICHDLQTIFPYIYAQTYLTPPFSQTLNPHADDRDVIIIQLLGQKEWNVYEEVPIPYPYPHEQVGKRPDLPVPSHVINGPTSVSQTLRPGDMLYIPRGYVHQAFSSDDVSCHITIAIATFDWTLGASLHRLTQSILMQDEESRKSMLPLRDKEYLQTQIDRAMDILEKEITIDKVERSLQGRTQQHLQLDDPIRDNLIKTYSQLTFQELRLSPLCVGPQAARRITWTTKVRAATPDEKAAVVNPNQKRQRPLFIRPDTRDDILPAMAQLKTGGAKSSCSVLELRSLCKDLESNPYVDDLTLLAFAKQAVALGALAVAEVD